MNSAVQLWSPASWTLPCVALLQPCCWNGGSRITQALASVAPHAWQECWQLWGQSWPLSPFTLPGSEPPAQSFRYCLLTLSSFFAPRLFFITFHVKILNICKSNQNNKINPHVPSSYQKNVLKNYILFISYFTLLKCVFICCVTCLYINTIMHFLIYGELNATALEGMVIWHLKKVRLSACYSLLMATLPPRWDPALPTAAQAVPSLLTRGSAPH